MKLSDLKRYLPKGVGRFSYLTDANSDKYECGSADYTDDLQSYTITNKDEKAMRRFAIRRRVFNESLFGEAFTYGSLAALSLVTIGIANHQVQKEVHTNEASTPSYEDLSGLDLSAEVALIGNTATELRQGIEQDASNRINATRNIVSGALVIALQSLPEPELGEDQANTRPLPAESAPVSDPEPRASRTRQQTPIQDHTRPTQQQGEIEEPVAQEIPNSDQIHNPPVRNTMRQATIAPGAIVFEVNADNSLGKRIASFPDGAEGIVDTRDVVLLNDDFYLKIQTSRGWCYVRFNDLDFTPLTQQLTQDK